MANVRRPRHDVDDGVSDIFCLQSFDVAEALFELLLDFRPVVLEPLDAARRSPPQLPESAIAVASPIALEALVTSATAP